MFQGKKCEQCVYFRKSEFIRTSGNSRWKSQRVITWCSNLKSPLFRYRDIARPSSVTPTDSCKQFEGKHPSKLLIAQRFALLKLRVASIGLRLLNRFVESRLFNYLVLFSIPIMLTLACLLYGTLAYVYININALSGGLP